jgi:sec-independent protein translocase protein TatC
MVLLTKFGAISTVKMRYYRKWAFMGAFAISAVLTPPDIITQVLLGFPLYGLYEFGLLVSIFFEDPKNRKKAYQDLAMEVELKKAKKFAAQEAKLKKKKKKAKKSTSKAG